MRTKGDHVERAPLREELQAFEFILGCMAHNKETVGCGCLGALPVEGRPFAPGLLDGNQIEQAAPALAGMTNHFSAEIEIMRNRIETPNGTVNKRRTARRETRSGVDHRALPRWTYSEMTV